MTINSSSGARIIRGHFSSSMAPTDPDPGSRPVRLKSGAWIHLRKAMPADASHLVEMHDRLSPLSRYHRYLRPHRPDSKEMEEICRLAPEVGEAFVAEEYGFLKHIVALIYYIRDDPPGAHKAEFGVTVEDGFQGGGLGRALLDHMCEQARRNGVRLMEANVLAQNKKMLHLLNSSGRPVHKSLSPEFMTITMDIGGKEEQTDWMCLLSESAASPAEAMQASALCG